MAKYLGKNLGEGVDESLVLSKSDQKMNQESAELNSKLAALKNIELEEISEEEEDDEDVENEQAANKRRTLLDKVVGEVFGKEKQRLYEMFPSIAVITVPKMPIITPKGDEIIMRKKYNNNMSLLNEAFEQKKQLYDAEASMVPDKSVSMKQEETSPLHRKSEVKRSQTSVDLPGILASKNTLVQKGDSIARASSGTIQIRTKPKSPEKGA